MTMADKVRAILKKTGMAQGELAARLDVAQPSVHRWLKGAEPEGHRRDAMLAQVAPENVHGETGTGPSIGRERP